MAKKKPYPPEPYPPEYDSNAILVAAGEILKAAGKVSVGGGIEVDCAQLAIASVTVGTEHYYNRRSEIENVKFVRVVVWGADPDWYKISEVVRSGLRDRGLFFAVTDREQTVRNEQGQR